MIAARAQVYKKVPKQYSFEIGYRNLFAHNNILLNHTHGYGGMFDYAWVDNTKPTELSQRNAGGSPWGEGSLASFFGRVNYNFNETYLFSAVMRADGSSNFSRGNRWGYFPSVSAGWVMTMNRLRII